MGRILETLDELGSHHSITTDVDKKEDETISSNKETKSRRIVFSR
jgi:hypothetical protein